MTRRLRYVLPKLRSVGQALAYNVWPVAASVQRLRPRAVMLVYHRVADATYDPYGQAVSPANFAQQLRLLHEHYHVEALDSFLEQLPQRSYRDRTVVVTFDDGYFDNFAQAYPIAASLAIPITVFITVEPVLEGSVFWWDVLGRCLLTTSTTPGSLSLTIQNQPYRFRMEGEAERLRSAAQLHTILKRTPGDERKRIIAELQGWTGADQLGLDLGRPMTTQELQQFDRLPGVIVGAHTLTHPALGWLSEAEQLHELRTSKRRLEALLNHSVDVMAYPFGKANDMTETTYALARQAGYRAAMTTMATAVVPSSAPYALPRLTVHNWSVPDFGRRLAAIFGSLLPWHIARAR